MQIHFPSDGKFRLCWSLWGNGNQSQLKCNTISGLYQSHWVFLHLDDLLCTQLHAVQGWLLKPVVSERECQGQKHSSTIHLIWQSWDSQSRNALSSVLLQLSHANNYTLKCKGTSQPYDGPNPVLCFAWFKLGAALVVSEPTLPLRKGSTNVSVTQTSGTDKTELLPFI